MFDKIVAFERGTDLIDLSAIDANSKKSGDQAFKFIGKKDFTGKAGQLRWEKKGGSVLVQGDTNGDGKADFQIKLAGINKIGADDFVL